MSGLGPLARLLVLSGLLGACLGVCNVSWHLPIERAAILIGRINHSPGNPVHMAVVSAFSLVGESVAVVLWVTQSEIVTAVIVSGLVGMLAMQALSALVFAVNRDWGVALAAAVFIYVGNFVGKGVIYPIYLMGFFGTEGVVGLTHAALVVALLGCGAWRSGLILLGLLFGVHPAIGCWTLGTLIVAGIADWRRSLHLVRTHHRFLVVGFAVSVAGFLVQLPAMRGLPRVDEEVRALYCGYIQYWDAHRGRFFWDYAANHLYLGPIGVRICLYSICVGLLGAPLFREQKSVACLFRIISVSGVLSLLAAAMTHIPPTDLPIPMLAVMPGRFINFNNLIFIPLAIGVLTSPLFRGQRWNMVVFLMLLLRLFVPEQSRFHLWVATPVVLLWMGFCLYRARSNVDGRNAAASGGSTASHAPPHAVGCVHSSGAVYAGVMGCVIAVFVLGGTTRFGFAERTLARFHALRDRTNDAFYRAISERPGLMLTTRDHFLISMKTHRPLLLDPAILDHVSCTPQSSKAVNRILNRVYGADLREPAPQGVDPHGSIPPAMHQQLWEDRSREDWQSIRKEFGVTDVLTATNFTLRLPVVLRDDRGILYEIPETGG